MYLSCVASTKLTGGRELPNLTPLVSDQWRRAVQPLEFFLVRCPVLYTKV
jgi:hypothetical protein